MIVRIASTFTDALARLTAAEQKAVKLAAFELQVHPSGHKLQMHRLDRAADPDFWSARASLDLRIICHRAEGSLLIAYVGHHDEAYRWAQRRRIEVHPTTGAAQLVELREVVREAAAAPAPVVIDGPFAKLTDAALLGVGVPPDWLGAVRDTPEENVFTLMDHLPAEAAEALLDHATGGSLARPALVAAAPTTLAAAFAHPDAERRFRVVENEEELARALDWPWERWGVFLHPSQRAVVERRFAGPARVAGSAGTGKTVVALHRAARLAREEGGGRVLLTTFSDPLARALSDKLAVLAPPGGGAVQRITVSAWPRVAEELFQLIHGARPRLVAATALRAMLADAAVEAGVRGFTPRFLESEWLNVVDAWGINGPERYATVPRLGRRAPLGPKQRERLWSVFGGVAERLRADGLLTPPGLCREVAAHYAGAATKPFAHVVVDEAQDLGPAELTMLRALAGNAPDALFFAGDLGQRIFQHPFSWASLGVDVRGRSSTLKVCYRTSRQIRRMADRLLPTALSDADGNEDARGGTVSVFEGPVPDVRVFASIEEEIAAVASFLERAVADGATSAEIGLFVRTPELGTRARAAADLAGCAAATIAPMHLAKGLEFRAVAVMACDEEVLPLDSRVAAAADEGELDDIYETERQLFYVACTRARDRLIITGVHPASTYLDDLGPTGAVPVAARIEAT